MKKAKIGPYLYWGFAHICSDLHVGRVSVALDVVEGSITCLVPQFPTLDRNHLENEWERPYQLSDLTVVLPLGQLRAERLGGLEFSSVSPGTLSIYSSGMTGAFDLRKMTGLSSIALRPPDGRLTMTISGTNIDGCELVYSSNSTQTHLAKRACNDRWSILADENFTHFLTDDDNVWDEDVVQLSWSLLGGGFIQPFLRRTGSTIQVCGYSKPLSTHFPLLGRYDPDNQRHPLNSFEAIYQDIIRLNDADRNSFRANCALYLSAKSQQSPIEGGVLSIFGFLEAVDGSRTMSWRTLQSLLAITRPEAEFIQAVRNSFAHGRLTLRASIEQERGVIADSGIFLGLRSRSLEVEFYLCMLMLVDRHLCRRFGITENTWRYAAPLNSLRAE